MNASLRRLGIGVATVALFAAPVSASAAPAGAEMPVAASTAAGVVQATGPHTQPTAAGVSCPFGFLCLFEFPGGAGQEIRAFFCGEDVTIPWRGVGSYINNSGTAALLEGASDDIIGVLPPGSSGNIDWTPVFAVEAC